MLDKCAYNDTDNETPTKGQRTHLSSNNVSCRCPFVDAEGEPISENIENLVSFGVELKKIYTRLRTEGYEIEEGKIYKLK